ncbi:histidine phosphatase family protein [Mesorhizobium plurifarium]|uniref:histidine phosphatase family protein n=1 Tax=Sinorhizobium arboris TaxID=76745 RepID=UPI000416955E|nr:histidine phosphatase family protein [Sinorhizobium arboris]PST27131.1 histidine phosphatase family protein [Mesorhizobium plurifarium]
MKDLFVVTHTQSIHHAENKVGGWYDTSLTPRGEIDARATAERLASLVGDEDAEIFSSDLLRASQTAAIIAKRLHRPVVSTADLREISYGLAGGMPSDWLAERQTAAPDDNRMDHRGGIEGAETRRDTASRVYRCVESVVERPCERQIIVTHGFALTFVIAAWIKMPLDAAGYVSFPAQPGSITHLRQDDFWKSRSVISLADISHLRPEATDG